MPAKQIKCTFYMRVGENANERKGYKPNNVYIKF
jgi:hypothetical protein